MSAGAEGDNGVLVVTSDEEELLLEGDAVVVGVPRGTAPAATATGAAPATPPSTPLPLPPAAEVRSVGGSGPVDAASLLSVWQ